MSLLLVLLVAFYFYFMLGLTFNAALRHQNARPRWLGLQRARE
jgi:hypothetical protein